ncbi:SIR2 family NAD-dependent protein deacylase [Plasticicumulans acidivorans]|uniref:NAD-dependent protein deacylase n=1 Tax=Plasticicumulans acidivorans TaxID=886464 RepID=A0A317MWH4_9GAMM|nr:NAD-dependent deacylase [Plasticicumulans acidivorans]PWV62433.1 NAD-dependent deacetylase [Plasticicumulans acidivorans]
MTTVAFPAALLERLRRARRVAALTGAGVSAESGVPTFRDVHSGLWARYRPEDLASPEAFARDPALVWNWYAWRRQNVAAAAPNPAHFALAALATLIPEFTLITQNVDGLHRRAGSQALIELHGSIQRTVCSGRQRHEVEQWTEDGSEPPRCPVCSALLRPDVVWFGESLPHDTIDAAFRAAEECEVFLCIGTSTLVYPAAELPFFAHRHGACVVEVNPHNTPLSSVADFRLSGPAGEVLPTLQRSLEAGVPC